MTFKQRICATILLAFAFFAVMMFAPAGSASAHPPHNGLAAGYFSAATSHMCPGGSNGDRCDEYGLARCWNPKGWKHTDRCRRYSFDYRTILHFRYTCLVVGNVNHYYQIKHLVFYGCWPS